MSNQVELVECELCVKHWKRMGFNATFFGGLPSPGPGYRFDDDYDGELPGHKKIGHRTMFELTAPSGTRVVAWRCQIKGMLPWNEVRVREVGEVVSVRPETPFLYGSEGPRPTEVTILSVSLTDYHSEGPYRYGVSYAGQLEGVFYWTQLCLEMNAVD